MRIKINPNGNPSDHTRRVPEGATILGTVTVWDDGDRPANGVLVRLVNGAYARVMRDAVQELLGAGMVDAELEQVGPRMIPIDAPTVKNRTVSIDEMTTQTLRQYGDGNLSHGIRKAAELVRMCGGAS